MEDNNRLVFLDKIKAICIFSLFIWHTCEVFHCKEGFYVEGEDTFFFTWMYCFVSPWLMAVMFFISGMAVMLSLEKRSIRQLYKDRLKRVLVPVLAGIALWVPIESFFCQKNHTDFSGGLKEAYLYFYMHIDSDMYGYDGSFTPAQLWFMCFLIAYYLLLFPLIVYMVKNKEKLVNSKIVTWKTIAVVILLTLVLSYGSSEETFWAFAVIFGLGIVLYNNKPFFAMVDRNWKILLILGIIFNIAASFALMHIRDLSNIWSLEYALCRLIWSIGRVTGVLATIGVGHRFLNSYDKRWNYFVKNSYNYYFLHMQVLICVAYMVVTYIETPAAIHWMLILILSSVLTFVVVEVMKRIKFFRWLFGLNA